MAQFGNEPLLQPSETKVQFQDWLLNSYSYLFNNRNGVVSYFTSLPMNEKVMWKKSIEKKNRIQIASTRKNEVKRYGCRTVDVVVDLRST